MNFVMDDDWQLLIARRGTVAAIKSDKAKCSKNGRGGSIYLLALIHAILRAAGGGDKTSVDRFIIPISIIIVSYCSDRFFFFSRKNARERFYYH